MAQGQVQIQKQEQKQKLVQTVTQQQLLLATLTEMPLNQFIERVNMEMNENPALEADSLPDPADDTAPYDEPDADPDEDYGAAAEREERQSALDEALSGIGRDDEDLPVYHGGVSQDDERDPVVYGSGKSFADLLKEQMMETDLTATESRVMEYLIGSLDDDGLLRKSAGDIADELAIYEYVDISPEEVRGVIGKLQEFDPPGIGAADLQECMLLQIRRKADSRLKRLMELTVEKYFDEFKKKHWDAVARQLKLDAAQAQALFAELRKLNPKPGAAMGETAGRSVHQITPDFIVETLDDGTVTFQLNNSDVPELKVSQSFADIMKEYQSNGANMSRQAKEALLYTKRKVDAAQGFIDAVKTRRKTLRTTMQAIISWQHRYFEDGDEASLRPMILKDIADKTGLDISTVSRVSNSKYAQTRWGTFPLRHFFSDSYVTGSGEELSTRQIKAALREIVENEDKSHPLSDDALRKLLGSKGFPIARRTVAKYREQMGIPIARLRK